MTTPTATHPDRTPTPPEQPWSIDLQGPSRWQQLLTNNILWIILILLALVVFFTAVNPDFVKGFNIRSIFADNAYLIVLGVGETFVLTTAGMDLSVGTVLILSGVIAGKVYLAVGSSNPAVGATNLGWGLIILGIVAGVVTGLLMGVVNGFLVAVARVPPFIVTLGTYGAALGASYLITGGTDLRNMPATLSNTIGFGNMPGGIPYIVIIALALAVLFGLVLAYTRFGRYTYAVGSNIEAARRAGINVPLQLIKVYAVTGLLSGCAGVLSLAHFTTTTIASHTTDNLNAIAGCVIGGVSLFGGRGLVAGAVIGILIPATLQSGFVIIGVNPYWQFVAVGVVLIGAVYLDQWRRRTREHS